MLLSIAGCTHLLVRGASKSILCRFFFISFFCSYTFLLSLLLYWFYCCLLHFAFDFSSYIDYLGIQDKAFCTWSITDMSWSHALHPPLHLCCSSGHASVNPGLKAVCKSEHWKMGPMRTCNSYIGTAVCKLPQGIYIEQLGYNSCLLTVPTCQWLCPYTLIPHNLNSESGKIYQAWTWIGCCMIVCSKMISHFSPKLFFSRKTVFFANRVSKCFRFATENGYWKNWQTAPFFIE